MVRRIFEYWIHSVYYTGDTVEVLRIMRYIAERDELKEPLMITRSRLITTLSISDTRFFTATFLPGESWQRGLPVNVAADGRFVTWQGDAWVHDDLKHLPRFLSLNDPTGS